MLKKTLLVFAVSLFSASVSAKPDSGRAPWPLLPVLSDIGLQMDWCRANLAGVKQLMSLRDRNQPVPHILADCVCEFSRYFPAVTFWAAEPPEVAGLEGLALRELARTSESLEVLQSLLAEKFSFSPLASRYVAVALTPGARVVPKERINEHIRMAMIADSNDSAEQAAQVGAANCAESLDPVK